MSDIDAITMSSLSLGLDAAIMRHQLIAGNIANANVLGYVPKQARFTDAMQAAQSRLQAGLSIDSASLAQWQQQGPIVENQLTATGAPASVHLDEQMSAMSQNAVQYQALLKGLTHHMTLLSMAVNDGKR